ncbi:MAG: FIST N-terminal domain-containing protein [Kofleriaceae bacterium]
MRWQDGRWDFDAAPLPGAALVLYFGASPSLEDGARLAELRERYPEARVVGCSTGGEILAEEVLDDSVVAAAVTFDDTAIKVAAQQVPVDGDSEVAGEALGRDLHSPQLRCVFVLSDGIRVNGSALVRGLRKTLGDGIVITGGLAGDGSRFSQTLVGVDGPPVAGQVVAVGFHGDSIRVGHGSVGGWESFGPPRVITRSRDNVLYEIDGEPALALYKKYLGKDAAGLPGSALHFPLSIRRSGQIEVDLVRTVLGVDEANQSMTFAGDMPEGAVVQLMRGSMARLVAGASEAAGKAKVSSATTLAVLVSCIGRKLLMGQRVSDEVEAVASALGPSAVTLGFYSYGEFSPHSATGLCELHNQTMTITTFYEHAA